MTEPAHQHSARIAGANCCLGSQEAAQPLQDLLPLLGLELRLVGRRHVAALDHLEHVFPRRQIGPDLFERRKALEIEISFRLRWAVALVTILLEKRANTLRVSLLTLDRRRVVRDAWHY